MTEREWLTSDEASRMATWAVAQGVAMPRRVRLVDCAAARLLWTNMTEPASRSVVEVAERFADGEADLPEVKASWKQAEQALGRLLCKGTVAVRNDYAAAALAVYLVHHDPEEFARRRFLFDTAFHPAGPGHPLLVDAVYGGGPGPGGPLTALRRRAQAGNLRCIFGNPFRPTTVDSALRTRIVVELAEAAYMDRQLPSGRLDPARLQVLSDALEDAGSTSAALIDHLRSPDAHVRGCWALDLLTGRV